jgi:hypothetical protein
MYDNISREWYEVARLLSKEKGEILQSVRKFGIEVECQYPAWGAAVKASTEIDKAIGIGTDGSVNGNGQELRLPPASGKAAEAMIKELSASLKKNDYTTDNSCGLHVHIDGADMMDKCNNTTDGYKLFQTYWLTYIAIDSVIRSFLPSHRLRNTFCYPMDKCFEAVKAADSYSTLDMIYRSDNKQWLDKGKKRGRKDDSRYKGINLYSFLRAGHPEIRYHNGTIDGEHMLAWANLHCLIMDKVMDGTITAEWAVEMNSTRSVATKTKCLFDKIGLKKRSRTYFKARQYKFYRPYSILFSSSTIMSKVRELSGSNH